MITQIASFAVNSFSLAMAIFLSAAGLTLIFGILKVLNFAQGAFIMIGAYLAYTVIGRADISVPMFVAVALGSGLVVACLGFFVDKLILARLRHVDYHYVLIASFALMLVCHGAVKLIWGLDYISVRPPSFLDQPLIIGDLYLSRYSIFVIVAGILVFAALQLVIHKLWLGKLMQALRSDAWIASLLGLNVPLGLTLSVMAGFFLAGIAGGLLLPNQSLSSGMGDSYLLFAFFAVIIGGLGNVKGAFYAAILLGMASSLNSMFLTNYPGIAPYVLLVIFLFVRPHGIFPSMAADVETAGHAGSGLTRSRIGRPVWLLVGVAVVAALFTLPFWADGGVLFLAGTGVIQGLFALSWNMLFGFAGIAAFGHAAFFGLGGYLMGGLLRFAPELPFLVNMLIAGVAGAALAYLVGVLALRRLSGIFLAILTIAVGEMIRLIISYSPHLGREDGLVNIPRPIINLGFTLDLTRSSSYYWFILTLVILLVAVLWWVLHGRFGRMLLSIRQDAERAAFVGINVPRTKIIAFMLSGAVAAVAGSIYAPWARIVTLDELHWLASVQPVLNSMLGGINSFWGPLLGAAVFTVINYGTRTLAGLSEVIVGLLLLGIILGAPNGIVGFIRTLEQKFLGKGRKAEGEGGKTAGAIAAKTEAGR